MKVKAKNLTKKQRIETLDTLYTAAASIHGREATKLFLRDLLTESERIMLGRRIMIARELILGTSRDEIAIKMRVGYDTIYKINRWLHDQFPGYEQAVGGIEKEFEGRLRKRINSSSPLYHLKKKYPLHFLLFPWPKL